MITAIGMAACHHQRTSPRLGLAILVTLSLICTGGAAAPKSDAHWVGTFQSSPATYVVNIPKGLPKSYAAGFLPTPPQPGTLRLRLGVSMGGSRLQVRISNEIGDTPLQVAGASIALAGDGMDAANGTIKRLTFAGKETIEIPAGAPALSDPVELT